LWDRKTELELTLKVHLRSYALYSVNWTRFFTVKPIGTCWAVHVTRMGKIINVCRILYHNSGRFIPLGRHICSSKNNIKVDLKNMYSYRLKWYHLSHERVQFGVLFNTIIGFIWRRGEVEYLQRRPVSCRRRGKWNLEPGGFTGPPRSQGT
jgi:hypothetical protein